MDKKGWRKVKAWEKKRRRGERERERGAFLRLLVIKIIRNNDASIVHRKRTRAPSGQQSGKFPTGFSPSLCFLFISVVMRFFFFLQTTTRTSMKRVYPNNGKRGSKEITPLVNYINRHRSWSIGSNGEETRSTLERN